jgi:hypothetical protein
MGNRRFIFAMVGIYLLGLGVLIGMLVEDVRFDESRSALLTQFDEDTHRVHERLTAIEREALAEHNVTP